MYAHSIYYSNMNDLQIILQLIWSHVRFHIELIHETKPMPNGTTFCIISGSTPPISLQIMYNMYV